jgi:hypothetical protein
VSRSLGQRVSDWLWNQPMWVHRLRGHHIETRTYGFGSVRVHVCSCDARWPTRPAR